MADYETFVKYVRVKSIIHTGSRMYFYLNNLCQKNDDLAERIFKELEQGIFDKHSSAGYDFRKKYRMFGKSTDFESRLREEFPTMKERLDDILKKKDYLQEQR